MPMSGKEPLQVRIPAAVKRAFKTYAAMRDIEPNRLFVEVWEHYEKTILNTNQSGRADYEQ